MEEKLLGLCVVHHALIPPPPEPLINIVGPHSKADACRWDWGRGHMPVCAVNLVVCQLSAGRWWMHSGNILGVWAMSFSLKSFGTLIDSNMATLKIKLYVCKQRWILLEPIKYLFKKIKKENNWLIHQHLELECFLFRIFSCPVLELMFTKHQGSFWLWLKPFWSLWWQNYVEAAGFFLKNSCCLQRVTDWGGILKNRATAWEKINNKADSNYKDQKKHQGQISIR